MTLSPYSHSQHAELLSSWYQARGMSVVPQHLLPAIGYVVGDCVAGFLYRTDSSLYVIEGFISDPFTHPTEREEGIGLLIDALLTHIPPGSKVLALSNHSKMQARATALGFHASPIQILEKDT